MRDNFSYRQQILYFIILTIVVHFFLNLEMLSDLNQSFDFSFKSELKTFKIASPQIILSIFYYLFYWYLLDILVLSFPFLLTYVAIPKVIINIFLVELSSLLTLFSLIDFYIFKNYGFHLGNIWIKMFSHVNSTVPFIQVIKNHLSISDLEYLLFLGLIVIVHILFIGILYYSKKIVFQKKKRIHQGMFFLFYIYSFLCTYIFLIKPIQNKDTFIIHQIDQYPLFKEGISQLIEKHIIEDYGYVLPVLSIHSSRDLKSPKFTAPINHNPPNILWIVIDTLRYDAITPSLTPKIHEFSQENIRFLNHWSSGNSTLPGVFGMLYGLPSNYFSSTVHKHIPPLLFQFLQHANYNQQVFFSGTLQNPPFIENAFHHLPSKHIHLNPYQPDGNEDTKTINQLINFLAEPHTKPFFSFVMLDSVHQYCGKKNYKKYYHSQVKNCLRWGMNNNLDPTLFKKRYENSVHHVDTLLSDVFKLIKNSELNNNTIVVFTSDHGEAFNDYKTNLWGHSNGYTPNLLHVPLVLHLPGKGLEKIEYQTTHYDIAITLLKLIFNFQQEEEQFILGHDLFKSHPSPFLLAGSYVNMALVTEKKYYLINSDGNIKTFSDKAQALPNSKIPSEYFSKAIYLMSKFYAS